MSASDQPTHELHPEESWEFLRSHEFGRIAFHLLDEVHIVPINYVVDDERLLFRTSEGSKLLGLKMNADVAFETDAIENEIATSVVIRGEAHELRGDAARMVEQLPLRPWVDTPKMRIVGIRVTEITGRRFDLARPWLRARVD
ncbi:MAG: pyridoxamine 5'-phosphate oxidase family protein [Humibacillus sp.]|nr:pyridoxamine 5'-phosphate oxidase family protein [Humibacillus sp.]MDN5777869.1 pyridoxamine 5'-phosphate oxidase family protein [Humibacillus sp.]